jgi:hypothetical protein
LLTNGGGGSGGVPTVAAAVVLATRQQSKQRQQQQHDNNTTTNTITKKDSQHGGGIIEWRERNCVQSCVFSGVSRYVSTPGQCYARQTSKGTFFSGKKGMFLCFWVKKNVPVDTTLHSSAASRSETAARRLWDFHAGLV